MKEKREDWRKRETEVALQKQQQRSFLFGCSLFRERGLINERDRAEERRAYTAENVIPERPNFSRAGKYIFGSTGRLTSALAFATSSALIAKIEDRRLGLKTR